MAVGAPDHIRLADDAHSRYAWRWKVESSKNLADSVLWTLQDLSFEGVLIDFAVYTDYNLTDFKIYVDDINIQNLTPEWLFVQRMLRHPGGGNDLVGVSRFDVINDHYSVWWQSHFKCYVKRSVKITAYQESGALKWIKYPVVHYLERI